ncbi:MAG: cysteate synthase [Lentimicrobiaceae bacterium]|nr:cysteate synthase [Lentimicrobiaceae bacterium]
MDSFKPTKYRIESLLSGSTCEDSNWILEMPDDEKPALIRARYANKQLRLKNPKFGLYQFADWLPIKRILENSSAPITYKSEMLAQKLGLQNLHITFSGYFPEKGATMRTCSFKETEAYSVCARLSDEQLNNVLVVASAGNTARAFAQVCSDNNIKLLLCVPEDNIESLWFEKPLNKCVKLIVTKSGSDYFDAIHLSNIVCGFEGFFPEGGAKNIARRDGMATTMLSATTSIGHIPDYYFQAIGSGTGAIAAWEANLRLLEDGRFGNNKMRLLLSQNKPFLPIYEAWKQQSREMLPYDSDQARCDASKIDAKVLSNRKPPYALVGGLFDALTDTKGAIYAISNEEARVAGELFEQLEGIDIHPAAAVATASLIQAVENGAIDNHSRIMLNITGGGEKRFKSDRELFFLKPDIVFETNAEADLIASEIAEKLHF